MSLTSDVSMVTPHPPPQQEPLLDEEMHRRHGLRVRRLPLRFESDDRRVITRPFIAGGPDRTSRLFERIDRLSDYAVRRVLHEVCQKYESRHRRIGEIFQEHYEAGAAAIHWTRDWSTSRRQLAGAYLTMEYAVDSAALFNPSIVPHPKHPDLLDGSRRFVMSLRATGEGHVSSIVFRTGTIHPDHTITLDAMDRQLSRARLEPDRYFFRPIFRRKLRELAIFSPAVQQIVDSVPERFTLDELRQAVLDRQAAGKDPAAAGGDIQSMLWLAGSNYRITLPPESDLSELVIFPISDVELKGIEDLRLVQFIEDTAGDEETELRTESGQIVPAASRKYFGTYTAYNGQRTLPMLMETDDFHRIEVHSLNGACARNKGMAMFPRRIGGHYCMCSRIDGENLFIMYSDLVHFWESAEVLARPDSAWEFVQIGNCGSPIETEEGWILLTHGVGPMREYGIGAMLLDLNDPLKVRGHLPHPLILPTENEREGYVPNVVYTCGAMPFRDQLYIPYALADKSTIIAAVEMQDLVNALLDNPPRWG